MAGSRLFEHNTIHSSVMSKRYEICVWNYLVMQITLHWLLQFMLSCCIQKPTVMDKGEKLLFQSGCHIKMTAINYTSDLVLLFFYVTHIFWFILLSDRFVYVSTFKCCAEYIFQWRCYHLQNESSDEQPLSLKIKGSNAALKKKKKRTKK